MNKSYIISALLTISILFLLRYNTSAQTYPLQENFDSEAPGMPVCPGSQVLISSTWHNVAFDVGDWLVYNNPTPTINTGPSADYSGTGNYLYLESTGCYNQPSILESVPLDFTSLATVELHFAFHMYGSTMGSLNVKVSGDGGANWSTVWSMSAATGNLWHNDMAVLTSYAGNPNVLIRFEGVTGFGEYSDIAMDEIVITGMPAPYPITESGTMYHPDLQTYSKIHVDFIKPVSNCALALQKAELNLNLNLGDDYKYGGTGLGGTIKLGLDVEGKDASGGTIPGCFASFTLELDDSQNPEELYIMDFSSCYSSIDHFLIHINTYSTGTPDYPEMFDDINLDVEVVVNNNVGGVNMAVPTTCMITLNDPDIDYVNFSSAHFSWDAQCDFPLYQFQLIRVHNFVETKTDPLDIETHLTEKDWATSALTLETRDKFIDLSIMEGTGYYVWRVMPVGNLFNGELADSRNYGVKTATPSPTGDITQINASVDNSYASVFYYTDPNDNINRSYTRTFSSNNSEEEIGNLLTKEGATYYTNDLFAQQSQIKLNSLGQVMVQQGIRDYVGRSSLQFMAVPIEKGQMDYETELVQNTTGLYTAEDFDGELTHANPNQLSNGALNDYYSDSNPDQSVPSAEGYPFAVTTYKNDGTGRINEVGQVGSVMQINGDYTIKMYYSSVSEFELLRVLGNETPNINTVEKVITISPEKVTSVQYIDKMGRVIASCLTDNIEMTALNSIAPTSGFTVLDEIDYTGPSENPFKLEVSKDIALTSATNVEINYNIQPNSFESTCYNYCYECDYKVIVTLFDISNQEVLESDTMIVGGEVCGGSTTEYMPVITKYLVPGEYKLIKTVMLNHVDASSVTTDNPLGTTYLDQHTSAVRDLIETDLALVSDTIYSILDSVDSGYFDLYDLYDYARANSNSTIIDGTDTTFQFDVNTCNSLYLERRVCKEYDCDTRDFAGFVDAIVKEKILSAERTETGCWVNTDIEALAIELGLHSGIGATYNNIVEKYGYTETQFNMVLNDMIADGTSDPDIYTGYTCQNIYGTLDIIAQSLMNKYTEFNYSILNSLFNSMGRHFKDYKSIPGVFGSTEGYMTHPYKYLNYVLGANITCQNNTGFNDLSSLDYAIESERIQIEEILYNMYACVYGPDLKDVYDYDDERYTNVGVRNTIKSRCEKLAEAREPVFRMKVTELMKDEGYTGTEPDYYDVIECRVNMLIDHAKTYCDLTRIESENFIGPIYSGSIVAGKTYWVDGQKGEYIDYNGDEYGPGTRHGEYFTGLAGVINYLAHGTGISVFEYDYTPIQYGTEEELEAMTRMMSGTVSLCATQCDSPYVYVDSVTMVYNGTVMEEDFSSATGAGSVFGSITGWNEGHGQPDIVNTGFGYYHNSHSPYALSLDCSFESGIVRGDGAYKEAYIDIIPGDTYELSYDYKLNDGSATVDNLYFLLDEQTKIPLFEGEDSYGEVKYPTADAFLVTHKAGLGNHISWITEQEVFTIPTTYTDTKYRLYIYTRQQRSSDSSSIMIDNIKIERLQSSSCNPLYVKYEIADTLLTVDTDITGTETCNTVQASLIRSDMQKQEQEIISEIVDDLKNAYLTSCPGPEEVFTAEYGLNYYHYTLYYYDAAGNLVKTVPPMGVDESDLHTRAVAPAHTYETTYGYDGLGNLVSKTTPDGGTVVTYYDDLKRVRFTQTAQDKADGVYRYICYDELSRPYESGVDRIGAVALEDKVNDRTWPATGCTGCMETVNTYYSDPDPNPAHSTPSFTQKNLTNRISYIINDDNACITYSYDAQGNVTDILQDVPNLGVSQVHYDYDEYTGNVLEVSVNKGCLDQFFYKYSYDEDGRLVKSYSSNDGVIWHRDNEVSFYAHGPVKRMEYGHYNVQGLDYTYNLHGNLIGLNAPNLDDNDPGQDGYSGDNENFATDVFGMQLSYYNGDFNRTGSIFDQGSVTKLDGNNLHNGNISAWTFQQKNTFGSNDMLIGYEYEYDELGRLNTAELNDYDSGWDYNADYNVDVAYDANGNITSLTRSAYGTSNVMDALTYNYDYSGTNQLSHIDDAVAGQPFNDLETQSGYNYVYDADGRLTQDNAEGITNILWRADGKVKKVEKGSDYVSFVYDPLGNRIAKHDHSGGTVKSTYYVKDAGGKTLAVYEKEGTNPETLAEFKLGNGLYKPNDSISFNALLSATTNYDRFLGNRMYEIADHLGNVRTVFSDIKEAQDTNSNDTIDSFTAEILTARDYYPFGMTMPGRSYNSDKYRYGYQGKEFDPEIKSDENSYDFHARFYDPRVGRWLSTDPLAYKRVSLNPYNYCSLNPIIRIDPSGEIDIVVTGNRESKEIYDEMSDERQETFLKQSFDKAKELSYDGSYTSWIIFKGYYSDKQLDKYTYLATEYGIDVKVVDNVDDILDYIFNGTESDPREEDLIENFYYYGHGTNQRLMIGYGTMSLYPGIGLSAYLKVGSIHKDDFSEELKKKNPFAKGAIVHFASCNPCKEEEKVPTTMCEIFTDYVEEVRGPDRKVDAYKLDGYYIPLEGKGGREGRIKRKIQHHDSVIPDDFLPYLPDDF